jgi:hypothetical protein
MKEISVRRIIAALIFFLCLPEAAKAQAPTFNSTGLVVAACGNVPTAFVAGRAGPITVDVNGILCDGSSSGASATNITTNTDTNVKASPGVFLGIAVNTAGVTSNVKIYNDADGTCSSGLIGTFATTAQTVLMFPVAMTVGICAKTAGGTPADITVLYR